MLARFRARGDARGRAACAGRGPQGDSLRAFLRFGEVVASRAALLPLATPFRAAGPLLGGPACGIRWRPAFFRCAPLPDSAFC